MRYLVFLAFALAAHAQGTSGLEIHAEGTQPKASAAEYPVQAESGNLAIGADYMVHSFGAGEQMYLAENYLVVEVALFPPKGESVTADAARFALRVNVKKTLLYAQSPALVASHLNRRDWETTRGVTADLGVGGVDIGLGQPQERDPVTGAPRGRRLPAPPRAPDTGIPSGVERTQRERPEELLIRTALPEVTLRGAVSGFLYFPYQGKASGLKSIDLLFQDAVMKLK
ncbi:MAG: hypothetical protein ACHP9S_11600 [Terriglobales bacterium]